MRKRGIEQRISNCFIKIVVVPGCGEEKILQ